MAIFFPDASDVFRDHNTKFIPSSGAYNPAKSYIRTYLKQMEEIVSALATADNFQGAWDASTGSFPSGAQEGYSWIASTPGTVGGKYFGEGDQLVALVNSASTSTYAGNWVVIPAWTSGVVAAVDAGAGTANAIQITTEKPVSDDTIVVFTLDTSTTSSPVTVSINGGAALTLKTNRGNDASALTAGMEVWGRPRSSDSTFRLLNDQDVSALVAQAESAKNVAVAAANNNLTFANKADVEIADVDEAFHSIELRGFNSESDGLGGQWTDDEDKGSGDTFTSADGRTWLRVKDVGIERVDQSIHKSFGTISITDPEFGASLSILQTPSQRRVAIQNAIDTGASLKLAVLIPSGTWVISDFLEVHSGSVLMGYGTEFTVIQASTDFPEDSNMLQPSAFDMSVSHGRISDLTLDGNRAARVAAGTVTGVGTQRPGSSGWASMSAHNFVLERVKSIGHVLHCFDDCCGGDLDDFGDRHYVWPEGPAVASATPSRNNIYIDCVAEDWSDDGFTSHFSKGGRVIRGRYVGGSDHYTDNLDGSCCIEFDDGSEDYEVTGAYCEGSARGIIAKNHDNMPCASNIRILNNEVVGCGVGITAAGYDADVQGTDCQIIGNIVRDPAQLPGRTITMYGIRVSDYFNVQVKDNRIIAPPDTPGLASGIYFANNATGIIDGNIVEGWPGTANTTDNTKAGIRVAANALPEIGSNIVRSPGAFGISWTGSNVGDRNVGLTRLTGTGILGSVALYTTGTWGRVFATQTGFDSAGFS